MTAEQLFHNLIMSRDKRTLNNEVHTMTLNKTTKLNKNMIATIIFGEYGWNFIFVNTKTNEYFKGEQATKVWLNKKGISLNDFSAHCWNMYNMCKNNGIECGMVSYFECDDEAIYKLTKSINVKQTYEEVFDF